MLGDMCSTGCSEQEARVSVQARRALQNDAVELPGSRRAKALAPVSQRA